MTGVVPQEAIERLKKAQARAEKSAAGLGFYEASMLLGKAYTSWPQHSGEALDVYNSLTEKFPDDFRWGVQVQSRTRIPCAALMAGNGSAACSLASMMARRTCTVRSSTLDSRWSVSTWPQASSKALWMLDAGAHVTSGVHAGPSWPRASCSRTSAGRGTHNACSSRPGDVCGWQLCCWLSPEPCVLLTPVLCRYLAPANARTVVDELAER